MLRISKIVQYYIAANKQLLGRFNCKEKLPATLRSCMFVFLCLVMISQIIVPSAAFATSSQPAKSTTQPDDNYLLDRVITWADGSKEHVQIGTDGFFRLDGARRKLIAMYLTAGPVPTGEYGEFFLPSNMALYEKELCYLQSIGIRVIHISLVYTFWYTKTVEAEQKAYMDLLDLLYRHKMLVIPEIEGKGSFVNGNLRDILFADVNGTPDSMARWAARWIDTVSKYDNVVGIVAENELDIKFKKVDLDFCAYAKDQVYTAADVADYMASLVKILRSKYSGPIIHKLAGTTLIEPEIKKAALNATDLGAFDCYAVTKEEMDARLTELQSWLSNSGYPTTGWWCMEFNAGWNPVVLDKLNSGLIESLFNHGAAIVVLFLANYSPQPAWQLFSDDGTPIPKLVEIARDFNKLQAPIIEPVTVASDKID